MKAPLKVRLIEFFIGNTRNKLTSLVLAVVVWAFAYGNTLGEESIEASLFVEAAGEDQIVVSQSVLESRLAGVDGSEFNGRCRVILSGPRNTLNRYTENNPFPRGVLMVERSGSVDLRGGINLQLPKGLSVQSVEPSVLDVQIDRVIRINRAVRPSVVGTPGPGFLRFPDGIQSDPPEVAVEGPSSLLEDDSIGVLTQEIDIGGVSTELVEKSVSLVITGDESGLVRLAAESPETVTVRIQLQQNLTQAQELVSVRYIVDEEIDLDIRGDRTIKVSVAGTEEAVSEWRKRVQQGSFYLLVKVSDTGGESINVPEEDVRWVDGSLPAGISRDQVRLERIILYSAKPHDSPGEEQQK